MGLHDRTDLCLAWAGLDALQVLGVEFTAKEKLAVLEARATVMDSDNPP